MCIYTDCLFRIYGLIKYFLIERIIERQSRRRRKDREERRRDIEIQRAEEVKWGKSVKQPAVRLDSKVHFPGFSSPTSDGDPPLPSPREDDPELRPSPEIDDTPSGGDGPSFAQVCFRFFEFSVIWVTYF